jgi:hypothetical protein
MDKPNKHVFIEHNGALYFFTNTKQENAKLFTSKCWFIVKNQHIPNIQSIADIWANKKYLKVSYPEHIEKMLSDMGV